MMVVLYFSYNFDVVVEGGEYQHLPNLPSLFSQIIYFNFSANVISAPPHMLVVVIAKMYYYS